MAKTLSSHASILAFLCLLGTGLILTLPAINAPFFWDDLHLIRVHSPQELAKVWTGTWDGDHVETPGFRPLTAYFNHLRALVFGESVAAHRIFLLVLFAAFLTMMAALGRQLFATTLWQTVLGGLLALLHLRSVYHYLWISDGIHLLAGILILGAILALLRALGSGRPMWLFVSWWCAMLALLVREDSLTVVPLLLWSGGAYLFFTASRGGASPLPKLALGLFAVAVLIALGIYWHWRSVAVPETSPLAVDPAAWIWALTLTVQNAGDPGILAAPWRAYGLLISLWEVWLSLLLIIFGFSIKRPVSKQILFWAGTIFLGALPNLRIARSNLLLLPVAFWGVLVAALLTEFWKRSSAPISRLLAIGMILFALAAPTYGSFVFQQEMRTNSLPWMCRNAVLLYGVSGQATIPPARREATQKELTAHGISGLPEFKARWPQMERKAMADNSFGVNAQGLPFIPRFVFLQQFQIHPRCEPPK